MLYEMITGDLPYNGANAQVVMRAKVEDDPKPPREVLPDIDAGVEEIIMRAIERAPRERYASAAEMLVDMEDPSKVVPRDRTERRRSPLLAALRVPRKLLAPVVLFIVIGGLGVLIWATSKPGPRIHADPPGAPAGSSAVEVPPRGQ
jgi:serine/threonine protein kinase